MMVLSEVMGRVEKATGPIDAVTAAGWANDLSPWETDTREWHLFIKALGGRIDDAIALIELTNPDAYYESGRTAKYPGMMPGSSPCKFYAMVGNWGMPSMGHSDVLAHALILALLRALHSLHGGEK